MEMDNIVTTTYLIFLTVIIIWNQKHIPLVFIAFIWYRIIWNNLNFWTLDKQIKVNCWEVKQVLEVFQVIIIILSIYFTPGLYIELGFSSLMRFMI